MFTTTKTSVAIRMTIDSRINKLQSIGKFTPVYCALLIFSALVNPTPVNATILTTLTGSEAVITKNVVEYKITDYDCGGYMYNFSYIQRVVINGQTAMVSTEFIYSIGTYTLTLIAQCGGYNLYGLGSCTCLKTDVQFAPVLNTTDPESDTKTPPGNIVYSERKSPTMAHIAKGDLWIRKNIV
jgi:hypothetical protein